MNSQSSSSSLDTSKYHVFLSFRGKDVRKGFVGYLYHALGPRDVYTYKDDERLEKGTSIATELEKAIKESGSAIVVLSKEYADSTWCLEELLHILKCHQEKDKNYMVFPVFYDVEPTEVRNQSGQFGEGFAKNREVIKGNKSKIEEWIKALKDISSKVGWDFKNDKRTEAELITDIVKVVSTAVRPNTLSFLSEDYVGKDVRLKELNQLLDLESKKKVLAVGIWGMGGIGKTTIAQLIFQQIKNNFEGSCFVENVKEMKREGLCYIQNLLHERLLGRPETIQSSLAGKITLMERLRGRRVFIVLDDVDGLQDLEYLIGKGKSRHLWFGEGSRIIITTRDEHLLETNGVSDIYEVRGLSVYESCQLLLQKAFDVFFPSSGLSSDESCQLLPQKAFKENVPSSGLSFDESCQLLLQKASEKNVPYIIMFRRAIEGIVRYCNGHPLALKVLGSSLHGKSVDGWTDTLDRLEQYHDEEILGPLKVSFDVLNEPEKAIFLDICLFNDGDNTKEEVEKMLRSFRSKCFDISISNLWSKSLLTIDGFWTHDLLSEMGKYIVKKESPNNPGKRSRVWDFNDVQEVLADNKGTKAVEVIHFIGKKSSPLRWNVDSLSEMTNLKCLICRNSIIGSPQKPCWVLKNLTIIDLKGSKILCESIDFSFVPNLQRLDLSNCHNVRKLDRSVGCLKHLVHLGLAGTYIESLPSNICRLTSLQTLDLYRSKCQLPEDIGNLKSLVTLIGTYSKGIWKLPPSIVHLSNLKKLELCGIRGLQLPNSLKGLCSLEILDLSWCRLGDGAIPDDIVSLSSLVGLNLGGNNFVRIPESIFQISQLKKLDLSNCMNLRYLPKHLPRIFMMTTRGCDLLTSGCKLLARYAGIKRNGAYTPPLWFYTITEDEYQLEHKSPTNKAREDLDARILGNIHNGHLFKIIWPLFERPEWFRNQKSCIKIELSTSTSALDMYGYALCVVYEVLGIDDYLRLGSTHVRKDFFCDFKTDQGPLKHQLEFDIIISKKAGLYGLLMYIPKDWFGDQLNGASFLEASVESMNGASFLQVSVESMNGLHVKVKACKADLISNGSTCFDYFSNELRFNTDSFLMTNFNN